MLGRASAASGSVPLSMRGLIGCAAVLLTTASVVVAQISGPPGETIDKACGSTSGCTGSANCDRASEERCCCTNRTTGVKTCTCKPQPPGCENNSTETCTFGDVN